ncbi:MAG: FAD-dependent thymidylate synthase [Thermaerobacterales bacterium]
MYTPEEQTVLKRHVTNLDRNVYAIFNLPQEVVAVIFAYVSRSPRSFRDNLLRLVLAGDLDMGSMINLYDSDVMDLSAAQEKARDFHERITLGYGHSSVAELAGASNGVEKVSRLASAELEIANRWLSFIEYSQRYQRPQRGWYVTPPEVENCSDTSVQRAYHRLQDFTFDVYERLLQGLLPWLEYELPQGEKESTRRYQARLEKIAFEDARYALTLAVQTNLGMTGNARAVRDTVVDLLSSPYREVSALGAAIKQEATRIIPTLIRYADPNPYQKAVREQFQASPTADERPDSRNRHRFVRLLDWTGKGYGSGLMTDPVKAVIDYDTSAYHQPYKPPSATPDQRQALARILAAAAIEHRGACSEDAFLRHTPEDLLQRYQNLTTGLRSHDHPAAALKHCTYRFEMAISEANWHQLLRHCRQIDFIPAPPAIDQGATIPPHIQAAGLSGVLMEAVAASETLYRQLAGISPWAAHYAVTNAHQRFLIAQVSLWEMFHLLNLRGKPETQWDIRQTVFAMRDLIRRVHPHLLDVTRRA